jgi:hypothetical protein
MIAADFAAALDPVRTFEAAFGLSALDWQRGYLRETRPTVVLKGRQVGASVAAGGLGIHSAIYRAGSNTVIVSPSLKQSTEITTRARAGLRGLGVALAQDTTAMEMPRAWTTKALERRISLSLLTGSLLQAIAAATTLPIVLGGFPEELIDPDALVSQRVRIALQGHAPFAAATLAVYATLKALRDGELPKNLKGLASSELTGRVTRDADMKTRSAEFLGLKR